MGLVDFKTACAFRCSGTPDVSLKTPPKSILQYSSSVAMLFSIRRMPSLRNSTPKYRTPVSECASYSVTSPYD